MCAALADPLVELFGNGGETAALAARYLRLSALGLPFALIALAGQGGRWAITGAAVARVPAAARAGRRRRRRSR